MAIESQIVNGTTIIIQEQVDYSWLGIVIASIVAIIALMGIILTNRRTRESNEELKKSNEILTIELRERYRPQLLLDNCVIQYESDETNYANFTCKISNVGKIALREIKLANNISTRKLQLNELINKEKDIWKVVREYDATLNPGIAMADYKIRFHEDNKKEIWITIWFSFKFLDNTDELIYQLHFEDLQYIGFDHYVHDQIEGQRKYSQNGI